MFLYDDFIISLIHYESIPIFSSYDYSDAPAKWNVSSAPDSIFNTINTTFFIAKPTPHYAHTSSLPPRTVKSITFFPSTMFTQIPPCKHSPSQPHTTTSHTTIHLTILDIEIMFLPLISLHPKSSMKLIKLRTFKDC